jgi:hypothetical protein
MNRVGGSRERAASATVIRTRYTLDVVEHALGKMTQAAA